MSRLLISLHNGAGDLVITFPFVAHLLSKGYDITYETVKTNFSLIQYFFKDSVKIINYTESPNPLERFIKIKSDDVLFNSERSYDYVVNLNNMYYLNEISHHLYDDKHAKMLNRQILVAFLFKNSYIMDIPSSLIMSNYFKFEKKTNNKILIFTYSKAAENRKLNPKIVEDLMLHYKNNEDVIINPIYRNLYDLCDNINNAKLVVTVDTAPLHISEILSTPWIGMLTNNSDDIISKYYIYKKDIIMSNVKCSPCNYHGGGCAKNTNYEYNCIYGFDLTTIVEKINNYIK